MAVRIVTDSGSDILPDEYENLRVLPLSVNFGATTYLDGVDLTHERFYELMVEEDELPKTGQVNPFAFGQAFEEAAAAGDDVVCITLSSKLSGTYQSALTAASGMNEGFGANGAGGSNDANAVDDASDANGSNDANEVPNANDASGAKSVNNAKGTVHVVDSMSVCVGERVLVEYALRLADEGRSAAQIAAELLRARESIVVVGLLDTLEYLRRGGRISGAAAGVGQLLSIKPVISIQDGEVVLLGKARGSKNGRNLLNEQVTAAGGIDFAMPLALGYAGLSDKLLMKYIDDSREIWEPGFADGKLPIHTVGATIGTHVGPGAIALAFFEQDDNKLS